MDAGEREVIRGEYDALVTELAGERYRHVAGLEAAPRLVVTFDARGRAAHRATARRLEEDGELDLARRVAELRAERVQAAEEEAWRAAETAATGLGPDGPLPLAQAQLEVARERDRGRRLALGSAIVEAAASASAAREASVEQRARARAEVGLMPDWEGVVEADGLLGATDDAYRDVLGWLARREAALPAPPHGELARADLLHVLALGSWAGLFRPGMLAIVLERTAAALRLDLRPIRVDDASRPGQWPGAHAHGTRVSLRRQGGAADWLGLLAAAGQALAAAAAPPHRRDAAAPFAVGELLAALLLEPAFLASALDVDRKHAPDLVRGLALRQLFRARAHAAAWRVATEVERGTSGAAWQGAYVDALTRAALATWPAALAARDGEAGRAAAALRGAARATALRRSLLDRFDEDWWRNPRTAEALAGWLRGGAGDVGEAPRLAALGVALVAKLA